MNHNDFKKALSEEMNAIYDFLVKKNESYGNSALEPVRIFSKADPLEQINVRIDDKLSRVARGNDYGEDVDLDLVGYFLIKRVHKRHSESKGENDA